LGGAWQHGIISVIVRGLAVLGGTWKPSQKWKQQQCSQSHKIPRDATHRPFSISLVMDTRNPSKVDKAGGPDLRADIVVPVFDADIN